MDIVNAFMLIFFVSCTSIGGTLAGIWYVGRRQRMKKAEEIQAIVDAGPTPPPLPPPNEPSPPTEVVHFSQVCDPNKVPEVNVMQIVDVEFIRKALSELAEALNATMAAQQAQAHGIAQANQRFLLVQAQVSTFDQDVRRIDAMLHSIRNPLPANKMYPSIEEFLLQKPKTGPAVPSINPEDDPNDIDPPDAEFDEAGNMIKELPTLARPEPAPPPILPKSPRKRGKKG